LVSCASPSAAPPKPAPGAFRFVDNTLGGSPATMLVDMLAASAPTANNVQALVRKKLEQPDTWLELAPRLLPILDVTDKTYTPVRYSLQYDKEQDYYYLVEPCPADQRIKTTPWWNTRSQVTVCKDDIRTEVVQDNGIYCESVMAPPWKTTCRCGAFLLNCAKDEPQREEMVTAAQNEIVWTLQHVALKGTLADLLLMPQSVRSSHAELDYLRGHLLTNGSIGEFDYDENAAPSLRPRPDAYSSGILTTPHMLFYDQRRPIIALLYQSLLCDEFRASGVTAETLLDFGSKNPQLRASIMPGLAAAPGCQSCHAKLENGLLAFSEFTIQALGQRPQPVADAEAKFYVGDHRDLRATGRPSVRWLGEQFAAQPELYQCIGKRIGNIAFGGYPVPDDVEQELVKLVHDEGGIEKAFEAAFVARVLGAHEL
jgi:hypothetical protein